MFVVDANTLQPDLDDLRDSLTGVLEGRALMSHFASCFSNLPLLLFFLGNSHGRFFFFFGYHCQPSELPEDAWVGFATFSTTVALYDVTLPDVAAANVISGAHAPTEDDVLYFCGLEDQGARCVFVF